MDKGMTVEEREKREKEEDREQGCGGREKVRDKKEEEKEKNVSRCFFFPGLTSTGAKSSRSHSQMPHVS